MTPQQATMRADKQKAEIREQVTKLLRGLFPNGHEDFVPQLVRELELHNDKSHDYASGGDVFGNFNRASAILALYPGLNLSDRRVYALVLALKQIDAVLWGLCKGINHKVEGLTPRLDDIAVYATIVKCMVAEDTRNAEINRQFGVDLATVEPVTVVPGAPGKRIEVSAAGVRQVEYPDPNKEDSPTPRERTLLERAARGEAIHGETKGRL